MVALVVMAIQEEMYVQKLIINSVLPYALPEVLHGRRNFADATSSAKLKLCEIKALYNYMVGDNWGKPERAPHRLYMCAQSVYIYVYLWYDRHPWRHSYTINCVCIPTFACSTAQACSINCHLFKLCTFAIAQARPT